MQPTQLAHPLPDQLVDLIAERFQVLAEPMRIKLLDRLRDGEATVGELVEATSSSQQNVSKHLRTLLQAGIVARRQDGNFARYSIVDETVFAICEAVCDGMRARLAELDAVIEKGTHR